ncbi:MAG: hypothetical protein M0P69_13570 [Bacteroidales bacterium]|jgi:hypothetical protein|nr:hypothetical protein [Bacteroidales bacterium]
MLSNDTLYLVTNTRIINALGDTIETPTKRLVYADQLSIGQAEFYQAAATGLRPELKFEIMAEEYLGEIEIEYNSKSYSIIRTYKKGLDRIELTCQGIVNGVV